MCCRNRPAPATIALAATLLAATLLAGTLLAGPAFACSGKTTVLAVQAYSSTDGKVVRIGPNEFEIRPDKNAVISPPIRGSRTIDSTICVEVSVVATANPGDTQVGVAVWFTSFDNFYTVSLSPDGHYRVAHILFGKTYDLAPPAPHAGIRQGLGQWNEIEVTTLAGGFEISVNGVKLPTIVARQPGPPAMVGLLAESPADGTAISRIRNLRISQ